VRIRVLSSHAARIRRLAWPIVIGGVAAAALLGRVLAQRTPASSGDADSARDRSTMQRAVEPAAPATRDSEPATPVARGGDQAEPMARAATAAAASDRGIGPIAADTSRPERTSQRSVVASATGTTGRVTTATPPVRTVRPADGPPEPAANIAAAAPAAAVAELVVTTDPPGARVTINGIGWGTTPVTIRHLPPGDKRIRVSKEGYAVEERVVRMNGGRHTVDVPLQSALAVR